MSSKPENRSKPLLEVRFGFWLFSPGIIPTLVTIVLLALLLNLGAWQIRRAEFKQDLIDRYENRSEQASPDLESLVQLGQNSMDYPIEIRGELDNSKVFLLDNRTHLGQPGFQLISPLHTQGRIILVNRGWVPMGRTRDDTPHFPKPEGTVTIKGHTHVPNPDYFVLQEDSYANVKWPFIIQKIDLAQTATLFDKPLAPFIIREAPDDNPEFVREWHSNPMGPEKHYGYAVQWFALAIALITIYIVVNSKRIHVANNLKEHE